MMAEQASPIPSADFYDQELSPQRAKTFFETGSKAGIRAAHAPKLQLQLTALEQAMKPEDLLKTSWELHQLKGDLKGHWALGNYRERKLAYDFYFRRC